MDIDPNDDIRRARGGDRDALTRLIRRHHDIFARLVRERLSPGLHAKARTSDILQSAYLEVLCSIEDFCGDDERSFLAWFRTIVNHQIADKARYFGRQRRSPEPSLEEPAISETPSAEVSLRELQDHIGRGLERLSKSHREALVMRWRDGRSHAEIAEALGIAESSARSILARARTQLALEIERARGFPPVA